MIIGARLAAMSRPGTAVLLDAVVAWDYGWVRCRSRAHLAPYPCGSIPGADAVEFGIQAAALHGAMLAGGVAARGGVLRRLTAVMAGPARLDDPALGTLGVEAVLERQFAGVAWYRLSVAGAAGRLVARAVAEMAIP